MDVILGIEEDQGVLDESKKNYRWFRKLGRGLLGTAKFTNKHLLSSKVIATTTVVLTAGVIVGDHKFHDWRAEMKDGAAAAGARGGNAFTYEAIKTLDQICLTDQSSHAQIKIPSEACAVIESIIAASDGAHLSSVTPKLHRSQNLEAAPKP